MLIRLNKQHTAALVLATLFLSVPVGTYAADTEGGNIRLGLSLQDFGYQEFDKNDVLLDREDGLLPGVKIEFSQSWKDISGVFSFELFDGVVDYDGQTQSGIPLTTKTAERIRTFEATLRYRLKSLAKSNVVLIAGMGDREWRRDIRATNITSSLYEIYRWKYGMLGAAATVWQHNKSSIGIDVRWLRPIQPTMEVDIQGFDSATLDLQAKDSARIRLPINFVTTRGQHWTLSPYWEYWDMGRSADKRLTAGGVPTGVVIAEPRNETDVFGVTLSVQLRP